MKQRRWRWIGLGLLAAALIWLAWQFRSLPEPPPLPAGTHVARAAWLGVTWAMEPHTQAEIAALAADLDAHAIADAYLYLSYLKPGDVFNPTTEHAAAFVAGLRAAAPDVVLLAWIGVPVAVTMPNGTPIANRLADPATRATIAAFCARAVAEFGYAGVHLNAETVDDGDPAYLALLDEIRAALPEGARFSVATHALRMDAHVVSIPYPAIAFHWSPDYLRVVAQRVDQVALMAYDSGLFLPTDYRAWVAYQTRRSAASVAGLDVDLRIGLPASEEWTLSHNLLAETLANGLAGFQEGLAQADDPAAVDGIAAYPYWEVDAAEWALIDALPRLDARP